MAIEGRLRMFQRGSADVHHLAFSPDLRNNVAERVGFEPTRTCTLPLFESGTFIHSDTSPLNDPRRDAWLV